MCLQITTPIASWTTSLVSKQHASDSKWSHSYIMSYISYVKPARMLHSSLSNMADARGRGRVVAINVCYQICTTIEKMPNMYYIATLYVISHASIYEASKVR